MVEVVDIVSELAKAKLLSPQFSCLAPDQLRFTTLLYQPAGDIEYGAEFGLRNRNHEEATLQFQRFLSVAHSSSSALVVCPEYSCPWSVVLSAVKEERTPDEGNLWVLGCESITRSELDSIRNECKEIGIHLVCVEPPKAEDGKTFFDPVCYIFSARDEEEKKKLVLVIQFKTEPMADKQENFEPNFLILGSVIYRFRNPLGNSIVLVTLLCSDVLAYQKGQTHPVRRLLERDEPSVILHLQLNQEPRHPDYAFYRDYCVRNREKDVICLNWARNAKLRLAGTEKVEVWKNSGASAVYSKKWYKNIDNVRAAKAHEKGIYLTHWKEPRATAAFLNFESLLFTIALTKVNQADVSPMQRSYQVPEVLALRAWDNELNDFTEERGKHILGDCDGCEGTLIPISLFREAGLADELVKEYAHKPFDLERLISLTTNRSSQDAIGQPTAWPIFESIDSMTLGPGEAIRRFTFIQDELTDAQNYRHRYLKAFSDFDGARMAADNFPDHLGAFRSNNRIVVLKNPACVNLQSESGVVGLFVFDTDVLNEKGAEIRFSKLKDYVIGEKILQDGRRHAEGNNFGEVELDEERVLLWYFLVDKKTGEAKLRYAPQGFVRKINDAGSNVPSGINDPK